MAEDQRPGEIMKPDEEIDIPEILKDKPRVQKALREAVQKAIRFHKLMGRPIIVWKDVKVVSIPPEEIELDEPTERGNLRGLTRNKRDGPGDGIHQERWSLAIELGRFFHE